MAHPSSAIIQIDQLVKKYHHASSPAVNDVSFTVAPGEFFALLGPNGAGKTTTISILTTILSKTSGNVKIAGFDVEKQQTEVRKNIGIIFQNPSLDVNLTAEENIRTHVCLYGLYPYRPTYSLMPSQYKSRVDDLAAIIGLNSTDLSKPVKALSGGMKRKLEIIRSLMHNPKVLFLDEPTAGLDPLSRKNLWSYLNQVRKNQNTTVFVTTHYLEEIENADNVCIINKGKIVALGSPKQLKKHYQSQNASIEETYLKIIQQDY